MKTFAFIISVFLSIQCFGQSTCDSLEIVHVNVDAFVSNRLNITLFNSNTQEIFDYPGFRVYDENDNLIGEEEVFFFGIGGESTHSVTFDDSAFPFLQGQEYTIRLELWTDFYSELACEFDLNTPLVPILNECIPISITFVEFSNQEVSYHWQLTDYWGEIIQDEILVFSENVGAITRNVCLDQSCFYLNASSTLDPEFSNLTVNIIADESYGFISTPLLEQSNDSSFVFSIWSDCSLINNLNDFSNENRLHIYPNPTNDNLFIQSDLLYTANFRILNITGIEVSKGPVNTPISNIDLSSLIPGIYILELYSENHFFRKKFIKN